jgi:hypothetical protein
MHALRHSKVDIKPESPEPIPECGSTSAGTTPSGRVRRHAASKASIKVANAIKQLKTGKTKRTIL